MDGIFCIFWQFFPNFLSLRNPEHNLKSLFFFFNRNFKTHLFCICFAISIQNGSYSTSQGADHNLGEIFEDPEVIVVVLDKTPVYPRRSA